MADSTAQVEALHIVLQHSFSPDASVRVPAEASIRDLKFIPGVSTMMLLRIAEEKQVQFEVRQAAAIQLKNICRECWAERMTFAGVPLSTLEDATDGTTPAVPPKKPPFLLDDEKNAMRTRIVEALLSEPEKSIRDLLAETVHGIAVHDFPEKWTELLPVLLDAVAKSEVDPLRAHNALLALRKVCKRYEYKSREQRGPLNDIVTRSFPLLLPLAKRLSGPTANSIEAALMLKQILKIFWSATQFYLPLNGGLAGALGLTNGGAEPAAEAAPVASLALSNPSSMQPWFEVLIAVLVKPLPEASEGLEPQGQPTTVEERNAWPWWKAKKWSAHIAYRLFSRYGVPNYAEDDTKEFAQYFSKTVAPQFLGPICETLGLRAAGKFCTDRVVHHCLSFVDMAVELSDTYKLLKPHMNFLIYNVCFPVVCLAPEDIEQFDNDPHEFVHRQNSPLADFYDPRMSAITLVTNAVKYRGKDTMQPLLGFLNGALQRYATAATEQEKNHIEKDGALLLLGSLSDVLMGKKKYAAELESLLANSVFPDFESPVGFLRCRACWMVQRFSRVTWTDDGTRLRTLNQLVLQRLSDPALPVQIEASKALRFLIEVDDETLLPMLPHILNEYFRIMNEIGNDEVIAALQVIIDKFGENIEPHAVALVTQLSTAFSTYVGAGEDDDDATMAAAQCLECINTVLKGMCTRPELYKNMEPHLVPLILQILGHEGDYVEYVEFALDTLTFMTYFPTQISPQLWGAFPLVYHAFDQWAFDYLMLMTPPLNNFIAKDPNHFLTGECDTANGRAKYIDLVFRMVSKTVQDHRSSESEARKALTLFMSVLHNCTGRVDEYLPAINDIVLAKLGQQVAAESASTRIMVFQVLGSCLYYNPQLQLAELEKRGVTQQVLAQWVKDVVGDGSEEHSGTEKWMPRKLTVLGLGSVLRLPTSALPPSLAMAVPDIISAVVNVTEKMKEESEGGDNNACEDDDDGIPQGGDEDDEEWEGFDEDQDVTNQADEAYVDALNKLSAGNGGDMAQFLVGDGWDDDFDDDEDEYYSPIDNIDELHFTSDVLREAFQREPEVFQRIQAALPPATLESCQKIFVAVDAQRGAAPAVASP